MARAAASAAGIRIEDLRRRERGLEIDDVADDLRRRRQALLGRSRFVMVPDIYDMTLNADVVVLSGCQTALGKQIRGEGPIGLARAFMYAGVPRVVASLWPVDDLATAELMKRFYRGMLVDRLTPAAALRAAQRDVAAGRRWASPYFWAPFVLQGDWR
jgi:CHAT domain-containing protein